MFSLGTRNRVRASVLTPSPITKRRNFGRVEFSNLPENRYRATRDNNDELFAFTRALGEYVLLTVEN